MSGGRRVGRKLLGQKAQRRPEKWKERVRWVELRARKGAASPMVLRWEADACPNSRWSLGLQTLRYQKAIYPERLTLIETARQVYPVSQGLLKPSLSTQADRKHDSNGASPQTNVGSLRYGPFSTEG